MVSAMFKVGLILDLLGKSFIIMLIKFLLNG